MLTFVASGQLDQIGLLHPAIPYRRVLQPEALDISVLAQPETAIDNQLRTTSVERVPTAEAPMRCAIDLGPEVVRRSQVKARMSPMQASAKSAAISEARPEARAAPLRGAFLLPSSP
jgi:hypothetical protein